ncbi:hypothetical protein, partial [Paraburkholderia mimosarum]|uniref:hypothetical protein n=1 Tax=Paraburkholderia mimosarum TaxID=312026 RepID=UPI001C3F2931
LFRTPYSEIARVCAVASAIVCSSCINHTLARAHLDSSRPGGECILPNRMRRGHGCLDKQAVSGFHFYRSWELGCGDICGLNAPDML